MADNDEFNDEYQFTDLDAINPEAIDDAHGEGATPVMEGSRQVSSATYVKRKAIFVVGVVIFAMITYKFVGSLFSDKPAPAKAVASIKPMPPKPQLVIPSTVVQPVVIPPVQTIDTGMQQKMSALELGQQSVRSEVSSVNSQLGGLTTNLGTLTAQIEQLNQTIASLTTKVAEQSQDIARLTAVRKAPKPRPLARKMIQTTKYYIQAVIPGRAWLIAANGSTLTVREGTAVPGYGVIKLIDPNQGRVLTSSGQVIRFSQEDS